MTQTIAAKLSVAIVAVAMAFSLVAPAAQAQDVSSMSLEQLVALVNSLQGQLGSASSSSTCSYTFTRSLSQGTTGADVMNLQKFLNSDPDLVVSLSGAGSPGMETSYYGPATAAAVSKFQVKYSADILVPSGLTSPTGYFGPASMAKANKLCDGTTTPTGPGTGNDGGLEGGAGDLESADFISSLNNEDVGEDEEDVEVMGLELEADDGSDLNVVAVRVELEHDSALNGSDDLDDYAESVSVWFEGEMVGSVDVEDMNESDDVWSNTISLDEDAIIRSGETGDLVVAITAAGNIDAADLASNSWSVKFATVRYEDAQGAIITESSLDDVDTYREFEFSSFADANEVELSINESDENPEAGTFQAEDAGDEVTLLIGEFEVEGSDIELSELRVVIDPTSSSTEDIASEFLLMVGDEEVSTVDASDVTSGSSTTDGAAITYTFEDIDTTLEEGETAEFSVVVVLNESGDDFPEGDSLTATITADATNVEAEDEAGEELTNDEINGGITGNEIAFASEGITVTMTDSDASQVLGLDTTASDDQGKYVMEFEVTAFEETAFIELDAASSTGAAASDVGVAFNIENTSNVTVAAGTNSAVLERLSGGSLDGNFVRINAGQTAKFRLTVYYDASATGIYRVQMNEVGYAATAVAATAAEATTPASDFQSDSVQVQN
jgi:hypothetical protein